MNSENRKTSYACMPGFNLANKVDLRKSRKRVALSDLSIYSTRKNIKNFCRNNRFKISGTTWDEEFELPDGLHSISDIQDYFEYIIIKHERLVDKPPAQIYVKKINNGVTLGAILSS